MFARFTASVCLMSILATLTFAAIRGDGNDGKPAIKDSITVRVVGTLRTGIVAIGGETTGTTITAKGITWELDFGKNAEFRETAKKLNGKKVVVQGSLERRKGIEIKERWIVTVTRLKPASNAGVGRDGEPGAFGSAER